MSRCSHASSGLLLHGLDGSNPLAFMAALGTLLLVHQVDVNARLGWRRTAGKWRACLSTNIPTADELMEHLLAVFHSLPASPLNLSEKLPFGVECFRSAMVSAAQEANSSDDRRELDFLAAFGSDALVDGENFSDTAFRMVRSGDSAGQGLPAYALAIRYRIDRNMLHRTLFKEWDYGDDYYSLRWDPVDDRSYALRWRDPAKDAKNTMLAANALAVESLRLFPTVAIGSSLSTTGFSRIGRSEYFTWPIWEYSLSAEMIRSTLTLRELHVTTPDIEHLRLRGISFVFRSRRFAPNKYYKNFTPAVGH
jgi:hypothetical protein